MKRLHEDIGFAGAFMASTAILLYHPGILQTGNAVVQGPEPQLVLNETLIDTTINQDVAVLDEFWGRMWGRAYERGETGMVLEEILRPNEHRVTAFHRTDYTERGTFSIDTRHHFRTIHIDPAEVPNAELAAIHEELVVGNLKGSTGASTIMIALLQEFELTSGVRASTRVFVPLQEVESFKDARAVAHDVVWIFNELEGIGDFADLEEFTAALAQVEATAYAATVPKTFLACMALCIANQLGVWRWVARAMVQACWSSIYCCIFLFNPACCSMLAACAIAGLTVFGICAQFCAPLAPLP